MAYNPQEKGAETTPRVRMTSQDAIGARPFVRRHKLRPASNSVMALCIVLLMFITAQTISEMRFLCDMFALS